VSYMTKQAPHLAKAARPLRAGEGRCLADEPPPVKDDSDEKAATAVGSSTTVDSVRTFIIPADFCR